MRQVKWGRWKRRPGNGLRIDLNRRLEGVDGWDGCLVGGWGGGYGLTYAGWLVETQARTVARRGGFGLLKYAQMLRGARALSVVASARGLSEPDQVIEKRNQASDAVHLTH